LKSKKNRPSKRPWDKSHSHNSKDEIKSFRENQAAEGAKDFRDLGHRAVPLKKIVGSVGRYRDFDHRFRLKKHLPPERLERIKEAMRAGKSLPPVQLYKIKNEFYVLDGNHRVAVANEYGWNAVEAHIVEYLPTKGTLENILAREKSDFEWKTGLYDEIDLTEVGQYAYLLEQISEHQASLDEISARTVGLKSAARDWHATIYTPFAAIIQRSHLAQAFPGRTLADLYAYISCHQWKKNRQRRYGIGIDRLIPKSMEMFRAKMAEQEKLDPPEMTRETTAFVLINVAAKREKRIMEKLYAFHEVREIHTVPGEFDIIAKIVVKRDLLASDSEAVGEFLQERLRSISGVLKTQTIIPISSREKTMPIA